MQNELIEIGFWQLGLAVGLMALNAAESFVLKLGLAQKLALASFRMVVQLLLVGLVLDFVFRLRNPFTILLLALVMTALAGYHAVGRTKYRYKGVYLNSFISVLFGSMTVTILSLVGIIRVEPWFEPQYLIPLLGMVLGNALNGIALGLDRFTSDLMNRRDQVEMLLALGASRWEAAHELVRDAVRTGMIPILNSMMVMGIVSLPGMMTGQILAGADPSAAVRYQIVIVFMIAASVALGTVGIVLLAFRMLFNQHHQPLWHKLLKSGQK